MEIEILNFGYSLQHEKHFMEFNIQGMNIETKHKIVYILPRIPLGDMKRFIIESDDESGLKILEYFPEEEYPFNKEIPDEDEIKKVQEIVKGFLVRD